VKSAIKGAQCIAEVLNFPLIVCCVEPKRLRISSLDSGTRLLLSFAPTDKDPIFSGYFIFIDVVSQETFSKVQICPNDYYCVYVAAFSKWQFV